MQKVLDSMESIESSFVASFQCNLPVLSGLHDFKVPSALSDPRAFEAFAALIAFLVWSVVMVSWVLLRFFLEYFFAIVDIFWLRGFRKVLCDCVEILPVCFAEVDVGSIVARIRFRWLRIQIRGNFNQLGLKPLKRFLRNKIVKKIFKHLEFLFSSCK